MLSKGAIDEILHLWGGARRGSVSERLKLRYEASISLTLFVVRVVVGPQVKRCLQTGLLLDEGNLPKGVVLA